VVGACHLAHRDRNDRDLRAGHPRSGARLRRHAARCLGGPFPADRLSHTHHSRLADGAGRCDRDRRELDWSATRGCEPPRPDRRGLGHCFRALLWVRRNSDLPVPGRSDRRADRTAPPCASGPGRCRHLDRRRCRDLRQDGDRVRHAWGLSPQLLHLSSRSSWTASSELTRNNQASRPLAADEVGEWRMTCHRVMGSALAALLLASSVPLAQGVEAGGPAQFTVGRYLDLQSADSPRISPDGTQVIYTRTSVNTQDDEQETSVWIVGADGQHHRFLAKGRGAVWAPDGKSIAYVAEGRPKGKQVFVLHLTVPGPASQLTTLEQDPADLHWSADGRLIGFTMVVPRPEEWSIDLPKAPEGAKWANTPPYTERLHYRRDGVGLTERGFRHLYLVDVDGGAPRQITTGDWSVGDSVHEFSNSVEWSFTPDGRSAIVEGFKEGDEDRNDQECYIYSVDLGTGVTKRLITTTGGWRMPTVSPDGKTIAYIGFTRNGDSYRVADLYTMSTDGSNETLRSGGFDREPQHLEWAPDSSAIYFTAEDHGSVHLYSWSAHGGVRALTSGPEVVLTASAGRGAVVFVRSDFHSPGDV